MKSLIVNADDFGMTEGVNRAILDAHQKGIVTSTTLLAGGLAFASAVSAALELQNASGGKPLGIGAHLNLSEGQPVSPAAAIPTLVDSQGRLHLTPGRLWWAIATRRVRLADIETELRAQIQKIVASGIVPDHLDGHMHVHVLPHVSEIVVRLACELGIPAVRCPVEQMRNATERKPHNGTPKGTNQQSLAIARRFVTMAVSYRGRRLQRLADQSGLFHPSRFYGIFETGFLNAGVVEDVLNSLPRESCVSELMCHPGYADSDLAHTGGRLQSQRETEVQALTSPAILELVAAQKIRLTTYRECSTARS